MTYYEGHPGWRGMEPPVRCAICGCALEDGDPDAMAVFRLQKAVEEARCDECGSATPDNLEDQQ